MSNICEVLIKILCVMTNISFENLPQAVNQLNKKLDVIEKLLLENGKQQTQNQPEDLLTVQQAAKFLTLSKPTIYSKCSRNELPYMKRGKRLYFSKTELAEYLKAGRVKTVTELENDADNYLKAKK